MPGKTAANTDSGTESKARSTNGHNEDAKDLAMEAAGNLKNRTVKASTDLAGQLGALRQQVEEMSASLAAAGQKKTQASLQKARRVGRNAAHTAGQGYKVAADYADSAYGSAGRFASKHPATALGLAAGLGLVAGFLLARR